MNEEKPAFDRIGVLLDLNDAAWVWERSSNHYGGYTEEILAHAGLPYVTLTREDLTSPLPAIVLFPYPIRLNSTEAKILEMHVRTGGAVMSCGGVEGADGLFGLHTSRRYLDKCVLSWPEGGLGLPGGELPVWGAQLAQATERSSLGEVHDTFGTRGVGAHLHRLGKGVALYLAVDISRSVVTIQQGIPVLGDGSPAPDGSAPIDDRLLKTDDGCVINWKFRQEAPEGYAFLVPYADRLRELFLAGVVTCGEMTGTPLPLVWTWPEALAAVGTLSFDTDSNEGPDGWAFLEVLEHLEVVGTWCVMYPGGYPRELYEAIKERGDEIALHFDGLTTDLNGAPHCGWSWQDFQYQHAWLLEETGIERTISQKNHVTRWEGWIEFFRWLEQAEFKVDQTKGPSKIGNLGFTFGTCHLWRPVEDARHENRLMNLYELPFLSHDMWHSDARVALRRLLLDAVKTHSGVAHFIFHPQRIHEAGMQEALADLVSYAQEQEIPWWTSARLAAWEDARRATRVRLQPYQEDMKLDLVDAPPGLTLLLLGLAEGNYRTDPRVHLDWTEYLGRQALRLVFPQDAPSQVVLSATPEHKDTRP